MQLDTIQIAQEALKRNVKDLNNQIEKNSSGELEIISEKLAETEDKTSSIENDLNLILLAVEVILLTVCKSSLILLPHYSK